MNALVNYTKKQKRNNQGEEVLWGLQAVDLKDETKLFTTLTSTLNTTILTTSISIANKSDEAIIPKEF